MYARSDLESKTVAIEAEFEIICTSLLGIVRRLYAPQGSCENGAKKSRRRLVDRRLELQVGRQNAVPILGARRVTNLRDQVALTSHRVHHLHSLASPYCVYKMASLVSILSTHLVMLILLGTQARNEEKAQSMLYRFREAQAAELGLGTRSDRRPRMASACKSLRECERWRGEILREISRKVSKIQDGALRQASCVVHASSV